MRRRDRHLRMRDEALLALGVDVVECCPSAGHWYKGPTMAGDEANVIGVADLARRLRRSVEAASARNWVQGELAGVKRAASGHCYFSLKDEREDAVVDCVMYRAAAFRARRHLSEGARVQVHGRATVWMPRGRLQYVVESVRPVGRGALLEALERLKLQLAAEGLFASERKRKLPALPRVVGVVTSAHGAAWHDIRTVSLRRAPVRLVLSPALVQGDGAVASLVAALDRLYRYPGLDVAIVGRGGGSLEDLMAFNDERVVRQVAASPVPIVSAVGHQIDTSLTDLAADARAATPSEAAELVVPERRANEQRLETLQRALARVIAERLKEDRVALERVTLQLSDPRFMLADKQQSLDERTMRLERRLVRSLAVQRARLTEHQRRLSAQHPQAVLTRARLQMAPLQNRLQRWSETRLSAGRGRLAALSGRLHDLSPLTILARGYCIALDAQQRAVRSARSVQVGDSLELRLAEGVLGVLVEKAEES